MDTTGQVIVLHTFSGPDNEASPAGLIRDPAGNIYGMTEYEGTGLCDGGGCGTVYKLSR